MRRPSRDATLALVFTALSFVLAFIQRPGRASSDTKIDLHVDPVAFLGDAASAWSSSIDLGAVQTAQHTGFIWPMGSVFAALHSLGLEPWVAHRLWLGLLFALTAWGMLRLCDAMVGRPRGVVHAVAAGFYLINPYVAVFTGRTSATLLGFVALPWLLLIVLRGVRAVSEGRGWRDWRGWWWAAAFALVLTSAGGGINGAVVGWMLVGPPPPPGPRGLPASGPLARLGRLRRADGGARRPGLGVVGGAAAGPRPVRGGLPPVHRAPRRHLGH